MSGDRQPNPLELAAWLRAHADRLRRNSEALAGKGWFPSAKHVQGFVALLENLAWSVQQAPDRTVPMSGQSIALLLAVFHRVWVEQAGLPGCDFERVAQSRRGGGRKPSPLWQEIDKVDQANPGLTPAQLHPLVCECIPDAKGIWPPTFIRTLQDHRQKRRGKHGK